MVVETNLILWGFLASLIAGLATGFGALPSLFIKQTSQKWLDAMLGFAAGIMLAATVFSLLLPSLETGGIGIAILGLIIGAILLSLVDRLLPHLHFISGMEGPRTRLKKTWLFIFAITLHNFPEGLSVGVSFGSGDIKVGIMMALAISIQNMPEGLAIALPLQREGYARRHALGYATLSGLVEPLAGLMGVCMITLFHPILPLALAFAAGAMLYVIFDEIIPESHRLGHEKQATFGGIAGFALMMLLDTLFG